MEYSANGVADVMSRRRFLGYSSLGILSTLMPEIALPAGNSETRLNPLFDMKLGIKFVLGGMVHETAHEGPCRVGALESLTYEAEKQNFERQCSQFVEDLKRRTFPPEAQILKPVGFQIFVKEKDVNFKFPEKYFSQIKEDIANTDLIVVLHGFASDIALKVAQRFKKPVATIGNDWVVDVPATLRHAGYEGHVALDWEDFNRLARLLWVRKAFSQTKLLIATDRLGQAPFGLASAVQDFGQLRRRYGMQYHHVSNKRLAEEIDSVIGSEAAQRQAGQIAKDLIGNARAVHMAETEVIHSVNFYLAVKRLMDKYGCNAFTLECREVCPLEMAAKYRFTPCMNSSLLKDMGYPVVCQTDINALIPMMAMSYLGRRTVYMGNPVFDAKNNILTIFHDVPGLKMKGFDTAAVPYELRNFTVGGWGVTVRYDFGSDKGQPVTIARANPGETRILVTKGEIMDGIGMNEVGCSLGVRIKLADTLKLFRDAADYGGHLVMAYGDYISQMEELSQIIGFDLAVV